MKIKKSSWHYRFMCWFGKDVEVRLRKGVTLCDYIFILAKCIILTAVLYATMLAMLSFGVFAIVIDPIIYLVMGSSPLDGTGFLIAVVSGCFALALLLISFGGEMVTKYLSDKRINKCSIITFEED